MAERLSWKEIDRMRDNPSARRKRREPDKNIPQHSTRYERYKKDLDRLFDEGLASELLKKMGKSAMPESVAQGDTGGNTEPARSAVKKRKRPRTADTSASRLKLMRQVVESPTGQQLEVAANELVERFGMPDDWDVLVRILEHSSEKMVTEAVERMRKLLPAMANVPRRLSVKERLRTIAQTASDVSLRHAAEELEQNL
ncbi:MAG: hypothetical protein D6806_10935 [Deltaproteobacteria bacterium]|nr:MAG: hypothetical protein D6806_10935 [Deltaproteobacteria bacterium]